MKFDHVSYGDSRIKAMKPFKIITISFIIMVLMFGAVWTVSTQDSFQPFRKKMCKAYRILCIHLPPLQDAVLSHSLKVSLENPNIAIQDVGIIDDKGRYRFTGKHSKSCAFDKKDLPFTIHGNNRVYRFSIPAHFIRNHIIRNKQVAGQIHLNSVYGLEESICSYEKANGVTVGADKYIKIYVRKYSNRSIREKTYQDMKKQDPDFPDFDIWYSDRQTGPYKTEIYEHKDSTKNINQTIECSRSIATNKVKSCNVYFRNQEDLLMRIWFSSEHLNDIDKVKSYAVNLLDKFKVE